MERTKLDQALDLMKEWQNENPETRAVYAVAIDEDGDRVSNAGILSGRSRLLSSAIAVYFDDAPESVHVVSNALGAAAYASVAKE